MTVITLYCNITAQQTTFWQRKCVFFSATFVMMPCFPYKKLILSQLKSILKVHGCVLTLIFHLSGQNVYDSLHIIFAILDTIRTSFFEGFYPKFMLPSFPWFHYPLYRISLVGSIYMTVATAIERYLAVCSPHNYHQMNMASQMRYIYYVVPVTVAATAVNVPRFFESEYAWR